MAGDGHLRSKCPARDSVGANPPLAAAKAGFLNRYLGNNNCAGGAGDAPCGVRRRTKRTESELCPSAAIFVVANRIIPD